MSDWQYAALVFYRLCWLGLPAIGMLLIAMHLQGDIRIPWLRVAQGCVLLIGLTFTGQSQTSPAWAQEQRENEARFEQVRERHNSLKSDFEIHKRTEEILRTQTDREVGKNTAVLDELEDEVNALQASEQRLYGIAMVLGALGSLIVVGAVEIVKLYTTRRNGRNGNGNGVHK